MDLSLTEVVRDALEVEKPLPQDAGVAALALTYAQQIDDGADASKLGPALLAALEALQMSPRARKAVTTHDAKPASSPLDQLAAARARKSRTEAMDAASS